MQDTDNYELAGAATCSLSELLKEVDVIAVMSGGFKEFTELIDNDEHAMRVAVSSSDELADDIRRLPSGRREALRTRKSSAQLLNHASALADDRENQPTLTLRIEGTVDQAPVVESEKTTRSRAQLRLRSNEGAEHQREGRLAAAVWTRPREGTLTRLHNLPCHVLEEGPRSSLADVA